MYKNCVLAKNIIPLDDGSGHNICFDITDKTEQAVKKIDKIKVEKIFGIISSREREDYINEVIFQQAYFSAKLGGAHIRESDAREAVAKPVHNRSISEDMVINNYDTINYVLKNFDMELNEDTMLDIYRHMCRDIVDENALNHYKLRSTCVWDVKHNSIDFMDLSKDIDAEMKRLREFTSFFNEYQCHPLIKSCIMYYYFLNNEPFYKGNGRIARMLVYMFLHKNRYKFVKCYSISKLLYKNKDEFQSVFEECNEKHCITKFVEYLLTLYSEAMEIIFEKYRNNYGDEVVSEALKENMGEFNKFQLKLLHKMASGKICSVSIAEYQQITKLSYRAAKLELEGLQNRGFLRKIKEGKKFVFILNDFEKIGETIN